MSAEYRVGFREALRVLKRDVDAHPSWGAGDIYDRIVELQGEEPRTVNSNRATLYELDERTEERIKRLETQLKAIENRPCTPERVMERVAYLEGQEKLTQEVFNEHETKLKHLQSEQEKDCAAIGRQDVRITQLETRQRVDASAVTNLDRRTRSLETNVADHEKALGTAADTILRLGGLLGGKL
jgi:DNA repair exonuclease SbcCD ATPase subunit